MHTLLVLTVALVASVGLTKCEKHRQFEYLVVQRQLYGDDEGMGRSPSSVTSGELNRYGNDGWQLVGLINANWIPGIRQDIIPRAQLIFKRVKLSDRTSQNKTG